VYELIAERPLDGQLAPQTLEMLEHYEQADSQTQRLVPLRKLYWPA